MALGRAYGNNPVDFGLEVSRGNVSGITSVNKFGANLDVDQATLPEDIWDFGGTWPQPTSAQIHNIVSSDPADDGVLSLTGALVVRVIGLRSWNTKEQFEDVITNGLTPVATQFAYVIIHRMVVVSGGGAVPNVGDITATAAIDLTVTAQISATVGQTLMAILGVPTIQTYFSTEYYVNWARNTGSANQARMNVVVKARADQSDAIFVAAHATGLFGAASSFILVPFKPPALTALTGPAIIKVKCSFVDVNQTELYAGFNGYLVDN